MSQEVDDLRALVAELQTQLAFQEDALNQLDAALAGQQQDMQTLARQFELLKERQKELATQQEQAPAALEDEKPPHY
jgi:SlyX protein